MRRRSVFSVLVFSYRLLTMRQLESWMATMTSSCNALGAAFWGCHNAVDEAKYQHNLLHEEVLKQQAHYEMPAKDVDHNVRCLVDDIRANWDLANQLIGKVEEIETILKRTIQDIEKGKDWSKTIDDGVLVTISEWMEKMEARMAEQELEIVKLRRQVWWVLCSRLTLWLT